MPCVELARNKLPLASSLAKLLNGVLASHQQNVDETLRYLVPLQADATLRGQHALHLHHALAWAYQTLDDPLRAIQQYSLAAHKITASADIESNQTALWNMLARYDRDKLVALRGESEETEVLGWIDLAISLMDGRPWQAWRKSYPDHPANDAWIASLASPATADTPSQRRTGFSGKVALLLPLSVPDFYPMADAIERGFSAARQLAGDSVEVQLIATDGHQERIGQVYDTAIREGAQFIVGPLTRDEVTQLSRSQKSFPVLTLALNQPETDVLIPNFHAFGLSAEVEAQQLARYGRDAGFQSALIVANETTLSLRMSKVFHDAWVAEGGHVLSKVTVKKAATDDELKALLANQPLSDMIVLAVDYDTGRRVRPTLLNATPIFGFSHLFSGIAHDTADTALNSVHFTDMPWLLNAKAEAYAPLQAAAQELPPGPMQRWFALGADAYQVLRHLSTQPEQTLTLNGLTGKLTVPPNGDVVRQLSLGQFTNEGVKLEKTP